MLDMPVNIRYCIDPEADRPHILDRGVAKHEVEEVLARPGEDRPRREGTRVALGRTRRGRLLRVVYVPEPGPDGIFVITAYDLKGKPLRAFIRPMRRRRT